MDEKENSSDSSEEIICVTCENNTVSEDEDSGESKNCICETCKEYIRQNNGKVCTCGICSSEFEDHLSLDDHATAHSIDAAFMCLECRRYFLVAVGQASDEDRVCKICREGDAPELNYFVTDSTDDAKFKCGICGTKTNMDDMVEHLWSHAVNPPYVCAICSKNFTKYYTFKGHMKDHFQYRI